MFQLEQPPQYDTHSKGGLLYRQPYTRNCLCRFLQFFLISRPNPIITIGAKEWRLFLPVRAESGFPKLL